MFLRWCAFSITTCALVFLSSCGSNPQGDDDDTSPSNPQETPISTDFEDFVSAYEGSYDSYPETANDAEEGSEDTSTDEEREVEEADIFVLEEDTLYILNQYRGLLIFDVSDPAAPQRLGRARITGYPIEMYVREGRAYIVVSDYFTYWRSDEADGIGSDSFYGSLLAIVDVADPTAPTLLGSIDLEGYVSQTRAVGDVIYTVSARYAYYSCDGSDDTEDMTYVVSIDISDPSNPHAVDMLVWPGTSAQVHATSTALYVAEPDYYYEDTAVEEDPDEGSEDAEGSEQGGDSGDSGDSGGGGQSGGSDASNPGEVDAEPPSEGEATPVEGEADATPVEGDPGEEATPRAECPAGEVCEASDTPIPCPTDADCGETSTPEECPTDADCGEASTPEECPAVPECRDEVDPDDPCYDDEACAEPTDPVEEVTSYYRTNITYVDISDPSGLMVQRGSFQVMGYMNDKFALDAYQDTFRVVTQKWDGVTSGTLTILDVSNPDEILELSELDILLDTIETVTATRFDGDRGYIVTVERTDPLFIVDLRDPTNPELAGEVHMPGQLDHLEILDTRLIAMGQDNTEEGTWLFAVSLFDVEDIWNPSRLDMVTIGDGDYSWSSATWDEKSFSLMPDEDDPLSGLVAVPFTAYTENYQAYLGGVQLLSYDAQSLSKRGMVTHPGYVRRVRPVGDYLTSLSDSHLLTIDVSDLDNPQVAASMRLAQYVSDYLPLGEVGVQLTLPWYDDMAGQGRARVVSGNDPDATGDALGELTFDLEDGQLVALSNDRLGLFRTDYDDDWQTVSWFEVFDISDPEKPSQLASLELPGPVWSWAGMYDTSTSSSGGVVVRTGDVLAYLEAESYYYWDDVVYEEEAPQEGRAISQDEEEKAPASRLIVIDISDLDNPTVSTLDFDEERLFGLRAIGQQLYATHAEPEETYGTARYFADVIDVSDPSSPAWQKAINVPGTVIHASDDGSILYTLDAQWETSSQGYDYTSYSLRSVEVVGERARSLSKVAVPTSAYSVLVNEGTAYILGWDYWWEDGGNTADGSVSSDEYYGCYYSNSLELLTVDLQEPTSLVLDDQQTLPTSYGYLRGADRGRLFIDGNYQGVLMFDIESDPAQPALLDFARTSGWVTRVRTDADSVYLPTGMYGVVTFGL